jgi:hypothetical protein
VSFILIRYLLSQAQNPDSSREHPVVQHVGKTNAVQKQNNSKTITPRKQRDDSAKKKVEAFGGGRTRYLNHVRELAVRADESDSLGHRFSKVLHTLVGIKCNRLPNYRRSYTQSQV